MSDATTQTVNAEVVDTDATPSVDTQPAPNQAEVEAKPAATSGDINLDLAKELVGLSDSAAINLIDAYLPAQWLQGVRLLNNQGRLDALKAKLPESVFNHFVKTVCKQTQILAYELNQSQRHQFNVTDNTGVYVQAAPMGGLGLEIGAHHKDAKDGKHVSHRVAIGAYIRHTEYKGCELTAEQRKAIADETAALLA